MKVFQVFGLALLPLAMAMPVAETGLVVRATNAVVDNLLFGITLEDFEARRNANDPSDVDYSSDGCSDSPDNPFEFSYLPACHRHDFGYQNYRIQKRFTKAAKAKIDSNFMKDLDHQCDKETEHKSYCYGLAVVYYEAVKKYGGKDATKRGIEGVWDFDAEE